MRIYKMRSLHMQTYYKSLVQILDEQLWTHCINQESKLKDFKNGKKTRWHHGIYAKKTPKCYRKSRHGSNVFGIGLQGQITQDVSARIGIVSSINSYGQEYGGGAEIRVKF